MLSPHLPPLDALEVLLALARTGSINASAREIGLSQQAVSARIASIEAQCGVALVHRTPRGSTFTDEGTVLVEWAARLLEVAAEVDAGIASLRGARHSTLRVGASMTIAEQLLPGWLVALRAGAARRGERPAEVILTAANSDAVAELVRTGGVDVGFVEGPAAPRGLRSRTVGHDRLLVVVAPDHPWARRRRALEPAELAASALVSREAGSGTRQALDVALRAALGSAVAPVSPALSLSSTAAIRAAVAAGAGPAVLSELAVAEDVELGRLIVVPLAGLGLRRALRVIWRGGSSLPAGPARSLVALAAARRRTDRGG